MATALAAQLQALATSAEGNRSFAKQNTRPSILFDARQAADIDTATIFSLAISGLEELATANPMFTNFKKTLFSVESRQTDRELQGEEFNISLNASIHRFMCLVADFLLLSAAHQTLEYLIRRYKIHIYNVDDLIRFTLPYHETSLFVRVVQLSNIEKTRWRFLEGVRKSGAAPPRELLVQQCMHDMMVLEGICESGQVFKIGSKALRAKTAYSFSVAIVIEVLDAGKAIDSTLVNKVLSYVVQSFDKGSSEESQVGGLMIIGTLASKAKLSEDTIALLFNLITRLIASEMSPAENGALLEMAVMVLIEIVQTQSVKFFPEQACRLVAKVRELPKILSKINSSYNAEVALTLLMNGLIRHCLSSPHFGKMLQELLNAVPLRCFAESVTLNLLELIVECLESQDVMDRSSRASEIVDVLLAIKDRSPEEAEHSINKFLQSHTGAKDKILSLLNNSLKGSLNAILPESNQSIYRSLQHPQIHVRMLAMQQVAAVAKNDHKMNIVCSEALLLGLRDTDLSVVDSVLSVDGLETLIDCEELLIGLASVAERCVLLLQKGPRSLRAEAVSVGKHCLKFMSSVYLEAHPSCAQRVGHILLNSMFLSPKSWKLNLAALKLSMNVEWNFFKGLSALKDKLGEKHDKEDRKVWLHEVNSEVIELLANGLSENLESLASEVIVCATNFERAKPLLVLALLQSLARVREELNWESVNKYLGFLKQEWIAMETSEEFPTYELNNEDIFQEKPFTFEFFNTLQREPNFAFTSLLRLCFYKVLQSILVMDRAGRKDYKNTICSVLEDLFVVFSSPGSKIMFEKHTRLLLKKLPTSSAVFLSSFFNAEGGTVPVSAQINSLTALLSHWNDITNYQKIDIQMAVPHLLVALSSRVKAIRRAAFACLSKLFEKWRESTVLFILPNGSQMQRKLLDSDSFETFMESIMEYKDAFVSNGDFICTFLTSLLGFWNGQNQSDTDGEPMLSKLRFKKPAQMSIYQFLLHNAFTMPSYAQATLIMALKGAVRPKDQALETKKIFGSLLKRWKECKLNRSNEGSLSKYEVQIFRHLLQVHLHYEGMFSVPTKGKVNGSSSWFQTLIEVLNTEKEGAFLDEDVIETLCTALSCLEERVFKNIDDKSQDAIFKRLIELSLLKPEPLQLASRTSLQKLHVHSSVVLRYINGIFEGLDVEGGLLEEVMIEAAKSLTAVLEFLLSKTDINDMHSLIPKLFVSLRNYTKLYAKNYESTKQVEGFHVSYVQQLLLEVLEKIVNSTQVGDGKDTLEKVCDVDFLVEFIHGTTDVTTLNQSLSLLTTLGRVDPDLVLEHVISVFSVLGETTLIQEDSHSYVVTEKLITAVIPSWLEKTKDPKLLLQIFVKALPDIPNHRRITLVKTTMRLMQESTSLHLLLLLLLESSITFSKSADKSQPRMNSGKRKTMPDSDKANWLETFTATIYEDYELSIRLPALLNLLKDSQQKQESSANAWELKNKVVQFISFQLRKIGISTEMRSKENEAVARVTLIKMLEEVLSLLQRVSIEPPERKTSLQIAKKSLQESVGHLLESITSLLSPGSFAEATIHLLKSGNENMKIKALRLIAAKMKSSGLKEDTSKRSKNVNTQLKEEEIPTDTLNAYEKLVQTIGDLLAESHDNDSLDVITPTISALHCCSQRLAKRIPSIFVANLSGLIKHSQQTSLSAPTSLQCVASIVSETGLNMLPMLNELIMGVIAAAKQRSLLSQATDVMNGIQSTESFKQADLQMAILNVLEAVVQNLGSFLNPYLSQILELLVLEPCFTSSTNKRLMERAECVRCLLPKTIPVRLLLNPLISVYDGSLQRGQASLLACIEMLSLVVTSLDKSSVLAHYKTVFELCLRSFDLRRRHPDSLTCVTEVETSVISLFSALVLKLSESTFKPLFVRVLEWAESELPDDTGNESKKGVLRNIVLYRVVNQLGDKLRSVFVPYFQYLLKGCVQNLTDGQDSESLKPRKKLKASAELMKKKAKRAELTSAEWHLRYLIISALHKCFLYDNIGFLDTQKFQMLLGPLVEQISVDKRYLDKAASDSCEWIPTTQDMDNALVSCLGQMAITAGSDLLWKPLNHEILLCTRSDAVHVRILSLDIVKFLVDNLKEDYLALLPETIPFLAELLEDHELTVVAKSQEIIKVLEELSGESLSQYL
eukprot:c22180_g1_i1 orf=112-6567(+)